MSLLVPYGVRVLLHRTRTGVERRLRGALHGSTPSWKRRPNVLPWLDRPDAAAALARVTANTADAELLAHWMREGYVILDDAVDPADIDAMVTTLDGLWDAPAPIPNLELLDLREEPDAPPRNVPHREVLAMDPPRRRRVREASDWRIHGFHYVNAAAKRLFGNRRLRDLASLILGHRARPFAAINFMAGSQQALHQDMAVFHIYPHNHLRTADPDSFGAYQRWVDAAAARFERREFLARKGQVLFWHGQMAHGGAPVGRRGSSRKSMVLHYTVRGADRAREVHGPFNW